MLETIDHLIAARDLGYIDPKLYAEARSLADSNYRLLNGYIAFLKKRKIGAHEPGASLTVTDADGDENDVSDGTIDELPLEPPLD